MGLEFVTFFDLFNLMTKLNRKSQRESKMELVLKKQTTLLCQND